MTFDASKHLSEASTTLSPKTTYEQDGTKDGKYTGLQVAVRVQTL